jgi:hypothetical protein
MLPDSPCLLIRFSPYSDLPSTSVGPEEADEPEEQTMTLWERVEKQLGFEITAVLYEEAELHREPRLPSGPVARPILLLHGFASTPRMLAPLERSLRHLGRKVIRVPISPGREDLRKSAREVQRLLEKLSRRPGFQYADVVGHSMGGLVATYLLKRLDRGRRIRSVVTLGTPHRGAPVAALGALAIGRISRSVWQMVPGSEFVRGLAALPVPHGSSLISIRGGSDWVVPQSFSQHEPCERTESYTVERCSHIQLLVDRASHALVGRVLEHARPRRLAEAA